MYKVSSKNVYRQKWFWLFQMATFKWGEKKLAFTETGKTQLLVQMGTDQRYWRNVRTWSTCSGEREENDCPAVPLLMLLTSPAVNTFCFVMLVPEKAFIIHNSAELKVL